MNAFSLTSASERLGERGFTLLEILIAITLLAFVSLGVVNITENAVETKDRTTEVNENNLQIETAMSRFEWDFSQIYSPLYFSTVMNTNPNSFMNNGLAGAQAGTQTGSQAGVNSGAQAGIQAGMASPYLQQYLENLVTRFQQNEHFSAVSKEGMPIPRFFSPEKSTFEFFTSSNRRKIENQKQSHFAWVRYTLADQEELPDQEAKNEKIPKSLKSLVRYFASDDPYSPKRINIEDVERVKGAVLLRNVESLEFQFWDYQRRKWETSLRSVQGGENQLRGVRMIVTWYDSFGNKKVSSRIFRNHWPMVAPQDTASGIIQPTAAGANSGATAGAAAGTTSGT